MLEFLRERLPEKLTSLEIKSLIGEERTNKREKKHNRRGKGSKDVYVSSGLNCWYCLSDRSLETEKNLMEKGFLSSRTTFRVCSGT